MAGIAILIVAVIAAVVAALVLVGGGDEKTDAALTPERAQTAIQDYMDALSNGDTETVARKASCGLFDEITERKADMSLGQLASDAFRRQYKGAEITSIDRVVTWSPNQAQVLFTMQVQPARAQGRAERQAVAQILTLDGQQLVCSYLPRTGQF
jgi:hypothetical protein